MRVVVDANIVFSGILKTNGNIGDLLINSSRVFNFIAPEFLRIEIQNHYPKLVAISKLSLEQIIETENQICKYISFISEKQIYPENWFFAYNLVNDIDSKDIVYIAYTQQFNSNLWTGDKRLTKGLLLKGYKNILTTDNLLIIRKQQLYGKYHNQ